MIIKAGRAFISKMYWRIVSRIMMLQIMNDRFIVVEAYFKKSGKNFTNHNWGDDLNKYLFEYATNKIVFNIPFSTKNIIPILNSYSLIGSILNFYNIENKIIYGSGIINPISEVIGIPNKIISVRGPKTRNVLISKGIKCPESYGDPALLLPLFYQSKSVRADKVGLIVNMGTKCSTYIIDELQRKYDLKIISMTRYDKWTDIIDEICSCKFIISESLHGLIVAETYGIPNVWVECKVHPDYWDFKFEDYFESIGKSESIIKLQNEIDYIRIEEKISTWRKGEIDYCKLLSLFPFPIECELNMNLLQSHSIAK